MLVINLLIATSYIIRAVANLWMVIPYDENENVLVKIQYRSCKHHSIGFALYIFFLHFFGEILPLSLIFYMQVYM